jgi:Polysaccharide deacetylase
MNNQAGCVLGFVLCCILMLQGCAAVGVSKAQPTGVTQDGTVAKTLNDDAFIPKGTFQNPTKKGQSSVVYDNHLSDAEKASTMGRAAPLIPTVWLYTSPSFKKFSEGTELDSGVNTKVWETFLRKYQIPFKIITNPENLETSTPGILVLPSLVVLSEREKQAILKFRGQGGSVLSTWLTGVRNENGDWLGFSFMKTGLNVDVVGDTQAEEEANFMMAYGDSPVLNSLLAGQRIWIERLKGVYPLRLRGQQAAAQIMDWSRLSIGEKLNTMVAFGEHRQSTGVLSRAVVLGYPERLWRSADPKAMEAVAHNALTWLARQPNARLAAWPHPYSSALSIGIDAPDVVDDLDLLFVERVEKLGGKVTFYPLSVNAVKSAPTLKKLQEKGHEVGYMADRYEGFGGQPSDKQTTRISLMQQEFRQAGLSTGTAVGINAPLQSQDKTTQSLLNQQGFTYYVAFMDETDGRLPVLISRATGVTSTTEPLVMLPRTQSGPEDLMAEGDPDEGLKKYLAEFESALPMGGLLFVRFPNQTLLTEEQLDVIFGQMKTHAKRLWVAPNGAVARWWLERNRVSVQMDVANGVLRMSVTVAGTAPLLMQPSVTVDLPYANDTLKLVPLDPQSAPVTMVALDPWRMAVSLGQLPPGTHRWQLQFERAAHVNNK